MSSIAARLRKLEAKRPAGIVLEIDIDGQTQRLSAAEFAARGLDFLAARIVAGNSLTDAKRLLDTFPSCII